MKKIIAGTINRFPFEVATESNSISLTIQATDQTITHSSMQPEDAREIAKALNAAAAALQPTTKRQRKKRAPKTVTE